MKNVLHIDGFRLTVTGSGKNRTVTLSRRADVACGLHRSDFSECSAREVERFTSIRRACEEYKAAAGISGVEIVTSYGAVLETV